MLVLNLSGISITNHLDSKSRSRVQDNPNAIERGLPPSVQLGISSLETYADLLLWGCDRVWRSWNNYHYRLLVHGD